MQDEEIGSEPSSEDEEAATERPYNSLLQLLNANSEPKRAHKRRKLDHASSKSQDSREVDVQEAVNEPEEQDVLENQEASEEEDNAEVDKGAESDDEDEDGENIVILRVIVSAQGC